MPRVNIQTLVSIARKFTGFALEEFHTVSPNSLANNNIISCNRVLNDLLKYSRLNAALELFDQMPERDTISWNILISGINRCGLPRESLYFYHQMVSQGIKENSSTFSSVISMCSNAGFLDEGLQIHGRMIALGVGMNIYVVSALIDLYMRMSLCDIALKMFNGLQEKNVAVWNLVLRGFYVADMSQELLKGYNQMVSEDIVPNGLTFSYLLHGCGNGKLLQEGLQLHCKGIKIGWSESNLFVANALVDFYSACGDVVECWKSFQVIPPNDVISWNSMVSVCATKGLLHEALEIFNSMHLWGKKPSARSLLGFLSFSSSTNNLQFGEQIHCCTLRLGLDTGNVHIQSALIDMYGKCGDVESSIYMFESACKRDVECCNSLMTSLLWCGNFEDVVELFGLMMSENIGFDEVSLSSTLKALSVSSGSLVGCVLLHCCAIKSGFEYNRVVACSLIDSYSRSGYVKSCLQIFREIASPNVVCFTSIINAFARNGLGLETLDMFNLMIQEGLKPDGITFLCVLMGCNHSRLVQEGRLVFNSMGPLHGVFPEQKHYSCMVDLLGRAGLVDEAEDLMRHASIEDDPVMCSSLLRSCTIHRNEQVGRRAAEKLLGFEHKNNPSDWLQVSKFYFEIGDIDTAMQIREIAVARKLISEIGCSLIEVHDSRQM